MKTPENDQQKLFFDLVAAGTPVRDATVEANYTYRYGYELIRNYKEFPVFRALYSHFRPFSYIFRQF